MNVRKMSMLAVCVLALNSVAIAYPISLNIFASEGIWLDSFGGNLLPAGSSYQVWWTQDQNYGNGGNIGASESTLGGGGQAYGDFVLWSGTTEVDGGWSSPGTITPNRNLTDADVGGATISSGYVYAYVYQDGTPGAGERYVRTPIYSGADGSTAPVTSWGNAGATLPPPPDTIDVAPVGSGGAIINSSTHFVVPEPGTMALFGLGVLTIAARRRRK